MIIQKKDLLKVMQLLKPGIAKKDIIETFVHYIFTGEDVVTFNDEICLSHPFKTEFTCSARADELFKTVNGIKEDSLEISITDTQMDIKSAGTRANLAITPVEESIKFVEILGLAEAWNNMVDLPEQFLRGAFLCMFSASKDMTKGKYTCVCVSDDYLYSADGMRLSRYKLGTPMGVSTLIPARNIEELVKFPVDKFHLTDSWCHFGTPDGVIFSSRVMDGEFHDINPYFEIEGKRVRLPDGLRDLVSSVSFMTDGKVDKDKKVVLTVDSDKITCKGEKNQIGRIERDLDFEYAQEGFSIDINPVFLNEVLEKATIMKVSQSAALFTSGSFQHLISLSAKKA